MKNIIRLSFLFAFFVVANNKLLTQNITHSEMLGKPTDKSISIQVFFDTETEMSISFGLSSNSLNMQTTWQKFNANSPAEISLENLTPNSKYYYQINYRKPNTSTFLSGDMHFFSTQKSKEETFVFTVQADPHLDEQSDTTLYKLCLKNQLEDSPDFMIDLGDILMSDKLKNAQGKLNHDTIIFRANHTRRYYENISHSVPLFIALGNHEGEAGWNLNGNTENVAIWGTLERQKYFLNPYPNSFYSGDTTENQFVGKRANYYAWNWGNALFIVLDPYWYTKTKPDSMNGWRWSLGKTQYDWLKTTLEKDNSKFKFVFAHQIIGGDPDGRGGVEFANLYEWGGKNLDGSEGFAKNRPGWYKPIKDLLTENKVSVFFHGHDHFFGKQDKDCLIYQEVPQPSHPNFQNAGQADDYGYLQGLILPNSGHIRITVTKENAKIDYVRAYLPKNENGNRKNKDVSASYFISSNCYDSINTSAPVIWNNNYFNEIVAPNPFDKEANIEFEIQKFSQVWLSISDNNGKLIKYLLNGDSLDAGKFNIVWDGKNNFSQEVENGSYFYTLKTNNGITKSGKIQLLK